MLGLREITRTVGVSPNAAYRHFADLHALVLAIAHEAQRRVVRSMIETMPTPHQILLDTLDEMVGSGALSTAGRNGAEWTCWSTIHGFAELATHGALQGIGRPVKESLAAQAVDTLVDGLAPSHGGDR